jgi:hypothetical protein
MEDWGDFEDLWTEFEDFSFWQRQRIRLRGWRYHKGRMARAYEETVDGIMAALRVPYPAGEDLWPEPHPQLPAMVANLGEMVRKRLVGDLVDGRSGAVV